MSAAQHNIIIDKGADFLYTITHKNSDGTTINLAGATFYARLRETYDSEMALADFTCTVKTPTTLGKVDLFLAKEITELLDRTKRSQYVWDYKMIDNAGYVHGKLWGNVYVRGNASREDET
jgi:hypothetical protein